MEPTTYRLIAGTFADITGIGPAVIADWGDLVTSTALPLESRDAAQREFYTRVWDELDCSDEEPYEGPSCSLCDALGHGYPGGPPCPLEIRGYWDAREDEDYEAQRGVVPFDVAMREAMTD